MGALSRAIEILAGMPAVLDLSSCSEFAVLGDTHGYVEVTEWFLKKFGDRECLVILGDLVDRGSHGVENLELVARELAERSNLYVIRGNHESPMMNEWYGFKEEALRKRGRGFLEEAARLFANMPLAGVGLGAFFVHGGIPCRACLNRPEPPFRLDELSDILGRVKGTSRALEPSDPVAFQVLWNDPSVDIEWWSPNIRGPGTYYYGPEAWRAFLTFNSLVLIIRAHETVDGAILYTRGGNLVELLHYQKLARAPFPIERALGGVVTVFSSLYHGMRAAALLYTATGLEAIVYSRRSA